MNTPAWKAFLISVPVVSVLIWLVKFNPAGNFWGTIETPKAQCEAYDVDQLRTLTSLSPAIYDQKKLDRLIREPQNTFSNLPYLTIGLAVFLAARRWLTQAWGLGCMFLGIGSGLYHASLLPEWRLIDILGVYVALFGLIAIGVDSGLKARATPRREFATAGLIWIAAFWAGIHRNDIRIAGFKLFDSTYVVVIGVALGSILALGAYLRTSHKRRYFLALGALTLAAPLAFAGGLGDRFGGFLANPDAMIQGHSIWHALGAIALLAAYEVFASTGYDRSVFIRDDVPDSDVF